MILNSILVGILIGVIMYSDLYNKILIKLKLNKKPLSCALCMGFWISIIIAIITLNYWWLLYSGLVAFISNYVNIELNKI